MYINFWYPADEPILRYREKLREFEARGWRIDSDQVNRDSNKVAYAVPSPALRGSRGWVPESVPLVAGDGLSETLKAAES